MLKKYSVFMLCLCLTAVLIGCGRRVNESSTITSGEHESRTESAIEQEISQTETEKVMQLVRESGANRLEPGGMMSSETVSDLANKIGGLGLAVFQYNKAMLNYEKVVSFTEAVKRGEDAEVTVYRIDRNGVSAWPYVCEKGVVSEGLIYFTEDTPTVHEPSPVENFALTDKGNLLLTAGPDNYRGFRVVPLPAENVNAYWKYVLPAEGAGRALSDSWSSPDYAGISWEFVFEWLWEMENDSWLQSPDNPYYNEQEDAAFFPADVVEGTIRQYYDVPVSLLQNMRSKGGAQQLYNPQNKTYRIEGWRGGGYSPTTEVWGIIENADGSLSLEVASVSLEFNDEGYIHSVLTVMPQKDGGFKYLSNKVMPRTTQVTYDKYDTFDRYLVAHPKGDIITAYIYSVAEKSYQTVEIPIPDYMLTVDDYLKPLEDVFGALEIDRIVFDEEQNKICVNFNGVPAFDADAVKMDEAVISIAKTIMENQIDAKGVYFEMDRQPYMEPEIP